LIKDTKVEKLLQLDNIKVLQKGIPPISKEKNNDMMYYKDMEMYEITSRDLLKKRIKSVIMVFSLINFALEEYEEEGFVEDLCERYGSV
jgi:hypothetical protein